MRKKWIPYYTCINSIRYKYIKPINLIIYKNKSCIYNLWTKNPRRKLSNMNTFMYYIAFITTNNLVKLKMKIGNMLSLLINFPKRFHLRSVHQHWWQTNNKNELSINKIFEDHLQKILQFHLFFGLLTFARYCMLVAYTS